MIPKTPKMTRTTRAVLLEFLVDPDAELYGSKILNELGIKPGTLYPILARLVSARWLTVREERPEERDRGRPARRYYALTSEGWAAARRWKTETEVVPGR